MNVLRNKPVFQVKFKAINVSYLITVNGTFIHTNFEDLGQNQLEIPVNHFMRSGLNELGATLLPPEEGAPFSSGAELIVELWVKPYGKNDSSHKLCDLKFEASKIARNEKEEAGMASYRLSSSSDFIHCDEGDVEVLAVNVAKDNSFEGAYILKRAINVKHSLPLWGFFNGEDLPDPEEFTDNEYDAFRESFVKEYIKIHRVLGSSSEKAINEIMPLFEERNRELDQAYYLEPGTTERRLKASMLGNVKDTDRKLVPLCADVVGPTRHENCKLIELTRDDEGAAIGFDYISSRGSVGYDIIYYKKDGKWIISR